jgi:hypothetical protein
VTIVIVAATAAVLANAGQAQSPRVTLSNVNYSNGCRTRLGPPSSTLSPDNRAVAILFQGLSAEPRSAAEHREVHVA